MKALLRSTLCLLIATVASANADVLIYKGPARLRGDVNSFAWTTGPYFSYLVVDFDTKQSVSILTFNVDGAKKLQAGAVTAQSLTSAQVAGGKTFTILGGGASEPMNTGTFFHSAVSMNGPNVALPLRKVPARVQVDRPRLLTNTSISVNSTDGEGGFFEQFATLAFQGKATVAANDAGKTLQQVRDELIDDLKDKGFSSF